jgi:hypothetical protein
MRDYNDESQAHDDSKIGGGFFMTETDNFRYD